MPPIISIDTETFGMDSRRSPILQLGAVWTNEHEEIIKRCEWNIIPESVPLLDEANRFHDPKALARNGIDMEVHLSTAISAAEAWFQFETRFFKHRSAIQPYALGFNIEGYDKGFLRQVGQFDALFPYWSIVDLMHFVRVLSLGKGIFQYKGSLEKMAEALGVTIEGRAHTACRDAELTLLVHRELMKRISFQ